MAKMYFRYGAMNSGKSTAIVQTAFNYEERGQRALILKPTVDTKDIAVVSRIGAKRPVDLHVTEEMNVFPCVQEMLATTPAHCIIVDEVQFLTAAQVDQLFAITVRLGVPVMGFGLRNDFRTEAFPGSARMMALAHSIEELKTICRCGTKAIFNGRKIDGIFVAEGDAVAIDGDVEYESLCASCYDKEVGFRF